MPPPPNLRKDVRDMRRLIAKEKGEKDPLDLKYAPGGQVDLDFLAQYLCLKHAHAAPMLLAGAPADIFMRAQSLGFLAVADAARSFGGRSALRTRHTSAARDPRR
ncbi:MAG: hypothetical protein WDN29_14860 [Methylovirgula sp.]